MVRVLLESLELDFPMRLLVLSFVDYSLDEAISAESQPLDTDTLRYQAESARRRLNSRCKGLLEVPSYPTNGPEAPVEFLHRTVRDFVARSDIQEYFRRVESNFDPLRAISASSIFYLKSVERVGERRPATQNTVMNEFSVAATSAGKFSLEKEADRERVVIELERLFETTYKTESLSDEPPSALDPDLRRWNPPRISLLSSYAYANFLIWALYSGFDYCVRYIASHQNFQQPFYGRLVLRIAVRGVCTEAVEALLQCGIDPNFYGTKRLSPWKTIQNDLYIDFHRHLPRSLATVEKDRRKILELFDEYGARPRLHLKGYSSEEVKQKLNSRRLRWYCWMDKLTKGGLTYVMGIGRSNGRPKVG